jgi:2-dehydro-3-deoxygalactonokinase
MATMPSQFLSCDWGTSSFRLRLVSTRTGEVVAEIKNDQGIKTLSESANLRRIGRPDVFARVMRQSLVELAAQHPLAGAPLVISGMASSTIGWKELPYAKTPFPLDGTGLRVEQFDWESELDIGATYIVSGVATASNIMRGEECQVIGLLAYEEFRSLRQRSIVILPGTHSKHILIEDEMVTDFQTYMTGELFEALGKHTILSASCNMAAPVHRHSDFHDGVRYVRQNGLAASLFKVRTRAVLDNVSENRNTAFLSGLLIGAELADLDQYGDRPAIVAAPEELLDLYRAAMADRKHAEFISEIGRLTVAAHGLILSHVLKHV